MKVLRALTTTLAVLLIIAMSDSISVNAQSGLDSYGYAELPIEISDAGFVLPSAIPAGRTLITLRNTSADSRHAFLARLPDDVTIGELFATEGDAPPDWLWASAFPGFPGEVRPGETTQVVVDLPPGLYVIIEDNTGVFIVYPGDEATPDPVTEPQSVATVSLVEFGFELPSDLAAGNQIWKVVNSGQVPHELLLAKIPDGTTTDDLFAMLENDSGEAVPVGGIGWLSPGATGWTEFDLAPGTYAALCFVFDPEAGVPHAMEGMVEIFTIS